MNRRTWKDFLTKRSTIWTLSLCLVGAIVLGGMAAVNSSRNKNSTQPETELGQIAYLEEDLSEENGEDGSILTDGSGSGTANASGANDTTDASSSDAAADSGDADGSTGSNTDSTTDADASDSSGADSAYGSDISTDANGSDGSDAGSTNGSDISTNADASDGSDADGSGISTDTNGSDSSDADGSDNSADASDAEEASSSGIISEQALIEAGVSFTDDQSILWPCAGTVVIDYSMDKSVYFSTLNQYKYNPALIIGSDSGNQVLASARGIVESISIDEETGTTLVLNIGNGYKLTYGQLMEPAVSEGDTVEAGDLLAYISEPTKYYSTEGSNLYFAMTKDGEPIDPVLYLD